MTLDELNEVIVDRDEFHRLLDLRGGCRCYDNPPCLACSEPITEDEAEELGFEITSPEPKCPRTQCEEWRPPDTTPLRPTLFPRRGVLVCPKCNQGFGYADEADDDPMRVTRSFC